MNCGWPSGKANKGHKAGGARAGAGRKKLQADITWTEIPHERQTFHYSILLRYLMQSKFNATLMACQLLIQ